MLFSIVATLIYILINSELGFPLSHILANIYDLLSFFVFFCSCFISPGKTNFCSSMWKQYKIKPVTVLPQLKPTKFFVITGREHIQDGNGLLHKSDIRNMFSSAYAASNLQICSYLKNSSRFIQKLEHYKNYLAQSYTQQEENSLYRKFESQCLSKLKCS